MDHYRIHIFHSYSFTSFHNLAQLCIHQMEFEHTHYCQHNNILPCNSNKDYHYRHYLRFSRKLHLSIPTRTDSLLSSYNNLFLEHRCSFCICILVYISFCSHCCCSVSHIFFLDILHFSCNLNLNGTQGQDQLGLVVVEQHNNCLNNIDRMNNHYHSDSIPEKHTIHCSIYIQ